MDKIARDIIRHDTIVECIRVASEAMDVDGDAGPVAHAILDALKSLQSTGPVRVQRMTPVDYLETVQRNARSAWGEKYQGDETGPVHIASGAVDTPLGLLRCTTWKREWAGKRHQRVTWASQYDLKGEPVTIATLRSAGLAERPSRRNRPKGSGTKSPEPEVATTR
ncbi:MAG: hypothetical protein ACOH2L_19170 [Devosia sp.]